MGKPTYLTLIRCPRPITKVSNHFTYKATIYKTSYKNATIQNVRWQASSITHCTFTNSHCIGVDFLNSNLKKTSFRNAILEDVVFFNCNLKETDFTGAKFKRVTFITTNISVAKNLILDGECRVYRSYPKLELASDTQKSLLQLNEYTLLYQYNVLFVSKTKLNMWILQLLIDIYGDDSLRALCALKGRKNKHNFFTVHSYMKHIENYSKL